MAIRQIRTTNPRVPPPSKRPLTETTPLAAAPVVEQSSEPGFAPGAGLASPSFLPPNENVVWTDPKLDTTKKDSLGNEKTDPGEFGPKGDSAPPDVQTPAQLQAAADAREEKLRQHMGSTVAIDSTGQLKGRFEVTPQGHDDHGMRLPDKVDRSQVVEAQPVHVGPRGKGVPQDTFHGPRRVKG